MPSQTCRRRQSLSRGTMLLLALSLASLGNSQVSPGGVLFFGERAVRESIPSQAPIVRLACNTYGVNAIRADGTLVGWGDATANRLNIPADLTRVAQIASGAMHTVVLQGDGTVTAYGNNDFGQCNVPPGLTNVKSVWAGDRGSFAILNNGNYVWWGFVPVPPAGLSLSNVVQFGQGDGFVCALRSDGTVVMWGASGLGEQNIPSGLGNVVKIACGLHHTVALRADGTVAAWGQNSSGQATVPSGLNNVASIAAGTAHSVALRKDGSMIAWGANSVKQCNIPSGASQIVDIAANNTFTVAVKNDGTVFSFGDSNFNQTSVPNFTGASRIMGFGGNFVGVNDLKKISYFGKNDFGQANGPSPNSEFAAAAVGTRHVVGLKTSGKVECWGDNGFGQSFVPSVLDEVAQISAGALNSLAVKKSGISYFWGSNLNGQLTLPGGFPSIFQLSGGNGHTAILKSDSTVSVFGDNTYGQANVPANLSGVKYLSSGVNHVLALKSDGTVRGWGWNSSGQSSPPAGLQNVYQVAAGDTHSVALRDDGTVVGWGDDFAKQISPLGSLSNVAEVAASGFSSAALLKMHVAVAPYLIPGGQAGTGMVYLANPAPEGGQSVALAASDPSVLMIPTSVVVPEGARSAPFSILTSNPLSAQQVLVFATWGTLTQRCLVSVSPSPFVINYNKTKFVGGSTVVVTGTIKLPKSAPAGGMAIDLASDTTAVGVPDQAIVPAGKTGVTFTVIHGRVNSSKTPIVKASFGTFSVPTKLTVDPFSLNLFGVTPTSVLGSLPIMATVRINITSTTDIDVPILSDVPNAIANAKVTVPAGSIQATGMVQTQPVPTSVGVSLTANLDGSTITKSVKVFQAIASVVANGTLYGNSTMTIQANTSLPAPAGGLTINIATVNCTAPSNVTIPEGMKTATFTVVANDVATTTAAKITLSALGSSVTVTKAIVANLVQSLTLDPTTVVGGSRATVTGTINLASPVATDTVVTLASTMPWLISAPTTVTILAGNKSATFHVAHSATSVAKNAGITARRLGYSKTATMTVTP